MIAIKEAHATRYVNKKSCFTIASYSFFLPSHQSRRPSYLFTSLWISCIRRFVLTCSRRIKKKFSSIQDSVISIFSIQRWKRIENSFPSFSRVKREECFEKISRNFQNYRDKEISFLARSRYKIKFSFISFISQETFRRFFFPCH